MSSSMRLQDVPLGSGGQGSRRFESRLCFCCQGQCLDKGALSLKRWNLSKQFPRPPAHLV